MSDPTTLEELKTLFLSSDSTISTRELFYHMEQILYGTQHVKRSLDVDDTSEVTSNQDLFLKRNRRFFDGVIQDRYPALSDKFTLVNYTEGAEKQEWDIGLSSGSGLDTGLYVWLDSRWVSRCSVGDDLDDSPSNSYGLCGYRLANV